MTLILALPNKIYADRRVSDESGERCEDLCKLVNNNVLIAGFAGNFQAIVKAIQIVEAGEVDPKVIAKTYAGDPDDTVEGLCVKDGRILVFDCGRVWKRPRGSAFYCAGTGASSAIAYLSGRLAMKKKKIITEADIKSTFSFVGKVRTDCSKGYDCLEL